MSSCAPCRNQTLTCRSSCCEALSGINIAARPPQRVAGRTWITVSNGAVKLDPSMRPLNVPPFLKVRTQCAPSLSVRAVTELPESCRASRRRWNTRLTRIAMAAPAMSHARGRNQTTQAIAAECSRTSAIANCREGLICRDKRGTCIGFTPLYNRFQRTGKAMGRLMDWNDIVKQNAGSVPHFGEPREQYAAARSNSIVTPLRQFELLRFHGSDAKAFLQGQLTIDLDEVTSEQAQFGGYCNPKGRLIANFLLFVASAGYLMQVPRDLAGDLASR